jgi:hypothetical protein
MLTLFEESFKTFEEKKLLINHIELKMTASLLSLNLKSRYGARNRFQEPSLELSSQDTWAGGPVRQPYANLVAPIAGLKLPALYTSTLFCCWFYNCGPKSTFLFSVLYLGSNPEDNRM